MLGKTKLDSVEGFISKTLFDSNISHEEFVSISNAPTEYDDMKN